MQPDEASRVRGVGSGRFRPGCEASLRKSSRPGNLVGLAGQVNFAPSGKRAAPQEEEGLRLAEGAREEAGHHYRHPSAHLLTAPRRRAGDRTYKDKDLPSKRFHSKETGTEKVQNGSSWGWQALTCAGQKPLSYLAPGPAARPLGGCPWARKLGFDHLAPRRRSPKLQEGLAQDMKRTIQ